MNQKFYRSAFVSIVGRPSAGKSTLLNTLCGKKISITSPLPQTTRNKIRGILNISQQDNSQLFGQLVFLDTPGYHLSEKEFNQTMTKNITSSLSDCDIILYLMDASRPPGNEEESLSCLLETVSKNKPIICVLNKCDQPVLFEKEYIRLLSSKNLPLAEQKISSLKKEGIESLISALFLQAKEGLAYYPEEFYTDQEPSFRISESIREKAISLLKQEIPYSLFVEISDLEQRKDLLWVRAFILVETESQKGIVLGKYGKIIRAIREKSQKEIKKIMEQSIYLDLRVKVVAKWQRKKDFLKKILN